MPASITRIGDMAIGVGIGAVLTQIWDWRAIAVVAFAVGFAVLLISAFSGSRVNP